MRIVSAVLLGWLAGPALTAFGQRPPVLGRPPTAPPSVRGLPGGGIRPLNVTGGFSVNTDSREEVRSFYNAIYPTSDGVPMDTTADVATCTDGTNSTAFQQAVLRRINWFRAMAGVPASVTLDAGDSTNDQAAAVMMSANNTLNHHPPPTWICYSASGANAASNSNLALGNAGADAITAYVWDFGANNTEVGHRRWVLYPQTQVMGTGDVPETGAYSAANATWVFDANLFGTRPATRQPYVAWPPEGYVPYPVVYPQWSFALSNADLSAATVSMTSNGVSVPVALQPYQIGFGENTLVWVPMGLDATSYSTTFPFDGSDTVYGVTVANIKVGASTVSYSYNVTVFDPAVPGADYSPPMISGPSRPAIDASNGYSFTPVNNPHISGYQWRSARPVSGNLTDKANNGLVNFTISPAPNYPIITNAPDGSGNCFHLAHVATNAAPQLLQLKELLLPAANAVLSFKSLLGYATPTETARVQVSTDGGFYWSDLFTEAGTGGAGESAFTAHSFSLSNYAGRPTLVRFNYDYEKYTGYYTNADPFVGWCIENIVVTNAEQMINLATNAIPSTNFVFTPTAATNYTLEARAVIFGQFPLDWGPVSHVAAVVGPPVIVMGRPALAGGLLRLPFGISSGSASRFTLLQTGQLATAWTTNLTAVLTTNSPGSYQFSVPVSGAQEFYRIQTP